MFTTDLTIVDLKIKERNLYKAIFSMNFHQVATPELGVDEARCYIFFFRERDKFSAYIVLYMPNSERRLFYTYSSNPFPEADLPLVENIARSFGEEMGFFLDEKSFASASSAEKNLWIDEQPLFGFKTPEELALAEAIRMSETEEELEVVQPTAPEVPTDMGDGTLTESPAPPVAQPMPAAREYQPPVAPAAQPAPVYQQAPAQPVPPAPPGAPVYYQPPPPPAPTPQPPAAPVYYQPPQAPVYYQPSPGPVYYQPAPPAPAAQPPAAPVYYQPAPPAPAAPQAPPQPRHQKEIEIEPQVEVEVEVDVRPPRQKSAAVPRPSTEKAKASGASPRAAARSVQQNPPEEELRAAQKTPAPKQQVKKETRGATDLVSRELEALARLMASF